MKKWLLDNFFAPISADLKAIITQNGDIKAELAHLRQDIAYLRASQIKTNIKAAAEVDSPELLGKRFGLDVKTAEMVDWSRVK